MQANFLHQCRNSQKKIDELEKRIEKLEKKDSLIIHTRQTRTGVIETTYDYLPKEPYTRAVHPEPKPKKSNK